MDAKLLAIDFDGVICGSSDIPVPGSLEALRFLMSRYAVYILTARKISEVVTWLKSFGFQCDDQDNGSPTWTTMGVLLITNRKIDASAFIDNKAIRFFDWMQCIEDIEMLAGW